MSFRKVLNRRNKKQVRNQEKLKKKGSEMTVKPTTLRPPSIDVENAPILEQEHLEEMMESED